MMCFSYFLAFFVVHPSRSLSTILCFTKTRPNKSSETVWSWTYVVGFTYKIIAFYQTLSHSGENKINLFFQTSKYHCNITHDNFFFVPMQYALRRFINFHYLGCSARWSTTATRTYVFCPRSIELIFIFSGLQ